MPYFELHIWDTYLHTLSSSKKIFVGEYSKFKLVQTGFTNFHHWRVVAGFYLKVGEGCFFYHSIVLMKLNKLS